MKLCYAGLRLALLAGWSLWLCSCAVSTPAGRAAAAPQLFAALPESQKQAAMEGRVVEGMSPDAVFLAWGQPDRVTRGSQDGQPFELWRYTQLQPVYYSNVQVGMGFGYAPVYGYGGRRYYDPGFVAVDTGPDYVPVTAAVVRFVRNRVTGWERLR